MSPLIPRMIIMATMLEAKPFVTRTPLQEVGKKPFLIFKNDTLTLVISGIGKANAAMAAAYSIEKFKPAVIFNFGAAGALDSGYKKGEMFQIDKIIEHDRPDFKTGLPFMHIPETMGEFQCAALSTSDKAAISLQERNEVLEHGGTLVDMEGAAIVQTCRRFQIPCYLFKYISDTPEDIRGESITENIRNLREKAFDFFMEKIITTA